MSLISIPFSQRINYLGVKITKDISMSRQLAKRDAVDARRDAWAKELPDVDTSGMATLGRMRRITLSIRPDIERIFSGYGLDSGEFDVIGTLLRSGPPYQLRPTELYRSLMISSGGLTDRLARLTKAGLVTRTPSPEDGRSLLVGLTAEGRGRAEAAFREDMAFEASLLECLSAQERDQLGDLLRKLGLAIDGRSGQDLAS